MPYTWETAYCSLLAQSLGAGAQVYPGCLSEVCWQLLDRGCLPATRSCPALEPLALVLR